MKKIRLALGLVALSLSASASAMPEQVPSRWWDQMMFRLGIMSDNSGFCAAHPNVWIC